MQYSSSKDEAGGTKPQGDRKCSWSTGGQLCRSRLIHIAMLSSRFPLCLDLPLIRNLAFIPAASSAGSTRALFVFTNAPLREEIVWYSAQLRQPWLTQVHVILSVRLHGGGRLWPKKGQCVVAKAKHQLSTDLCRYLWPTFPYAPPGFQWTQDRIGDSQFALQLNGEHAAKWDFRLASLVSK